MEKRLQSRRQSPARRGEGRRDACLRTLCCPLPSCWPSAARVNRAYPGRRRCRRACGKLGRELSAQQVPGATLTARRQQRVPCCMRPLSLAPTFGPKGEGAVSGESRAGHWQCHSLSCPSPPSGVSCVYTHCCLQGPGHSAHSRGKPCKHQHHQKCPRWRAGGLHL